MSIMLVVMRRREAAFYDARRMDGGDGDSGSYYTW